MNKEQYFIDSSFNAISKLSTKVRLFLKKESISEENLNAIDISLVEALNNVVEHSYKMQEGNKIELQVEVKPNEIIMSLSDWGAARTNFQKAKLEFDPEDIDNLPEGGMGLFIIEQLMDTTDYFSNEGKNTYKLVKLI